MNGNTVVVFKTPGYFKGDPNKIYEELNSIGDEYTPQQVVDFARNPDTELHDNFEWDDSLAANEWRNQQARVLMANIVLVDEKTEQPTHIRAISYSEETKSFKPTVVMVQRPDEYQSLVDRARRELKAFRRKYEALLEFGEIFALIDKM